MKTVLAKISRGVRPFAAGCVALASLMLALGAQAGELVPKVVVADDGRTLRFVYDDKDYGEKDVAWFSIKDAESLAPTSNMPWKPKGESVTTVAFDGSFAAYRPLHCGSWFDGFRLLKTISGLENLDTSKAASFSYMFYNCKALKTLDLSGLSSPEVTVMTSMFNGCTNLVSVDISGFDTSKTTKLHWMFMDCPLLTTIYVSDGFMVADGAQGVNMFLRSTALKGGKGTVYDAAHVSEEYARIDGGASAPGYFTRVRTAKAVVADGGKTLRFVYDSEDYGRKDEDWFSVKEAEQTITQDGIPWYSTCTTYTKVVFDPSFAGYRPKSCSHWFCSFYKLAVIEGMNNLDTSEVLNMSYLFWYADALTSLDLSTFDTSKVTDMSSMFDGCSSLKLLDVSTFDTSKVTDMSRMFHGCSLLKSLDVSTFDTSKVTDMSYMFYGCSSLTSLDVSAFDTANVRNLCAMFSDCSSLTSLDVSIFDTANVTVIHYMFFGCSLLNTIYVSDAFKTDAVTYSIKMFDGCPKLKGGAGTTWKEGNPTDKTYAHVDAGSYAPGYFTYKVPDTYRIRFDGAGAAGEMADMVCRPGKVYRLKANAFDGGLDNQFLGWVYGAGKKRYDAGMLVFDLAQAGEKVVLTAVWEKPPFGVQLWENGPYWAECNVGATKPEEYGYYFWWGDTMGYTRSGGTWTDDHYSDVTWVSSTGVRMSNSPFSLPTNVTYEKDISTLQSEGYIDSSNRLVAAYDAATAHLGSSWRMPTKAEYEVLIENCDCKPTTQSGTFGLLVTGRGSYSSKSIFLPAAGLGSDYRLDELGSDGYYWTSSPLLLNSSSSWLLSIIPGGFLGSAKRFGGLPVRPVRVFAQ